MGLDVLLTGRIGLKRLLAVRAEERARLAVTRHVPVERATRREASAALGALEVAAGAALVCQLVRSQHPFRNEIPVQAKFTKYHVKNKNMIPQRCRSVVSFWQGTAKESAESSIFQ